MGFLDGAVPWIVGLLVVTVIAVSVLIPSAITAIAGVPVSGTATGEVWAGTAATAHAMANRPVNSVTDFRLSTYTSAYNDTLAVGNTSVNTSKSFVLTTPIDDGLVSGHGLNITTKFQIGTGSNVTVYRNGVNIATVSATATHVFGPYTSPISPTTLTYVFNGENDSNVTNTTIQYSAFATNTNYSVSNAAAGVITPTVTGAFYTTYTHGTSGSTSANMILTLVPFLIGVVLLVIIISSAPWMQ